MLASDRHYLRNTQQLRKFIGEVIENKRAKKGQDPSDFVTILL